MKVHKEVFEAAGKPYPVVEQRLEYAKLFPGLYKVTPREWEVIVFFDGHRQFSSNVTVDVMPQVNRTKPSTLKSFRTITASGRFFNLQKKRLAFGMEKLFGQGVFYGPHGSEIEKKVLSYPDELLSSMGGNSFDAQRCTRVMCASFLFEALLEHIATTGENWQSCMGIGGHQWGSSTVSGHVERSAMSLIFGESESEGSMV